MARVLGIVRRATIMTSARRARTARTTSSTAEVRG